MSQMPPVARTSLGAATALVILGACLAVAPLSGQDRPEPLLIGSGVAYPPFSNENPTGGYGGFSFDLASEIAERIGRPGTKLVIQDFAVIFDGLLTRDFEVIVTPTNITPDRARRVLFSEGYMDTGLGFLVFRGAEFRDVADLRGKTLAVEVGTVSDSWASINEAWLGFSIQRYTESGDAVSAVINQEVFASLSDLSAATHMAQLLGIVVVGHTLPIAGKFGLAFHPDDSELRKEAENALECMKLDGTLADLHEKWFGFRAGEDTATNTVYLGYGHPGFEGYDAESHVPRCP